MVRDKNEPIWYGEFDKLVDPITQKVYGYHNINNSKSTTRKIDRSIAKRLAKIETSLRKMPANYAEKSINIIKDRVNYCATSEILTCIDRCINDLDLFPTYAPLKLDDKRLPLTYVIPKLPVKQARAVLNELSPKEFCDVVAQIPKENIEIIFSDDFK